MASLVGAGGFRLLVFLLAGLFTGNARDASFLAAKSAEQAAAVETKALRFRRSGKANAKDVTFLAFHGKGLSAFARMDNASESSGIGDPKAEKHDGYYRVLGITPQATQDEVSKAYRKASLANHPDRGGDQESFNEVTEAYKVLGDEDSRQRYDSKTRSQFLRFMADKAGDEKSRIKRMQQEADVGAEKADEEAKVKAEADAATKIAAMRRGQSVRRQYAKDRAAAAEARSVEEPVAGLHAFQSPVDERPLLPTSDSAEPAVPANQARAAEAAAAEAQSSKERAAEQQDFRDPVQQTSDPAEPAIPANQARAAAAEAPSSEERAAEQQQQQTSNRAEPAIPANQANDKTAKEEVPRKPKHWRRYAGKPIQGQSLRPRSLLKANAKIAKAAKELRQREMEKAPQLATRNEAILAKRAQNKKLADEMKKDAANKLDDFDKRSQMQRTELSKDTDKIVELAHKSNIKSTLEAQKTMGEGARELAHKIDQYGKNLNNGSNAAEAIRARNQLYHNIAQKKIDYSIKGATLTEMERSLQDWYKREGGGSDKEPIAPDAFSHEGEVRTAAAQEAARAGDEDAAVQAAAAEEVKKAFWDHVSQQRLREAGVD